jgi:uncharacterized membrane protein SpoIIM required for sporulation
VSAPAKQAGRTKQRTSLSTLDFRRRYEVQWSELESLVDAVLHDGLRNLPAAQLQRLIMLYRRTVGSLAIAREIALDQTLVDYLEALCARAYLALHGSGSARSRAFLRLFTQAIPRAVRRVRIELLVATALLVLGVAVGWILTASDPAWFYAFVDDELAAGRSPGNRSEDLEAMLYTRFGMHSRLSDFASFLFVHNASVAILAFALGFVLGLPTAYLLFSNGLTLGAFCALYFERGLGLSFLGWLLPHAVPELMAVLLCSAAGFAIARAVLFPGGRTIQRALQDAGRRHVPLVAGALVLLLLAAGIEGVFRQVVINDDLRFGLVAFNLIWIAAWFGLAGRRGAPRERSDDDRG